MNEQTLEAGSAGRNWGVIGTVALFFGGLTLAARGSIWPAAIAHGSNNSIGIMEMYLAG